MMRCFTALFFFLGLILPPAMGQQALIRGTITDAVSQEPLPGASIFYERGRGTVSDNQGHFMLWPTQNRITLKVQYLGYKPYTGTFSLTPNDTLTINIQLEPDVTQIDQVVVSAGRVEQRVAESTVSMSIIQPQQFTASHISDVRELMTKSPGIEVIDGQAAIRSGSGFSYGAGSRVLTLLDGLPILAADAGSIRWQFLPMENISQIEVIKGASSVLYGSSALNGVINFRTAPASLQGRNSFFAETGAFDNPPNSNWKWWNNTPRTFNTLSFSHLKKYNQTDIGLGLFGVLDQGYRRLNHENAARISLTLKHHNKEPEGLIFGVNALAGYTDKRDFVLWENAETGALKQDPETAINLRGTFLAIDPFIGFKPNDRQSHDLRMRFQLSDNAYPDAPNNESQAISFLAEYQSWYQINRFFNINIGVLQNSARILSQFYGNNSSLNFAAYFQGDLTLSQKLKMVAGVRLEHNSINGDADEPVVVARAGLNYMLANYTFLRASYGQGYRYPSIAERFATTTLGAVRIFPNIHLQPESGWNAEVGVKQGIVALGWDGMIDWALFYSQNKNLIEYEFGVFPVPGSEESLPGFRADNTEYSRVYGSEIEFLFTRSAGWFEQTISGGYLYTFPVEFNQSTGQNKDIFLKYRRKHSAKLSLTGKYNKYEPGITFYYRSKTLNIDDVFLNPGTREDILPGFFDYWLDNNKGFFLADVHISRQLTPVWKLSFAVKNITNTEYMGRPGDIRPHRNFSIRLSAMF